MKQIQKDVMHSSIVHRLNYRVSIPKITGNLRALSGSSEVLPLVHMRHFNMCPGAHTKQTIPTTAQNSDASSEISSESFQQYLLVYTF
jgi:hypothetical protein